MAALSVPSTLTHERRAFPSTRIYQGVIPIMNEGEDPIIAKISLCDYSYHFHEGTHFEEPGTHSRSNAPWISLTPSRITLAPETTAQIHYEVAVPQEEQLQGTYWCIIDRAGRKLSTNPLQ